ncbi:hypothetical protein AMECASPLE_020036 [Ameca splendens]|uniref:Secreted protein n=1 Tax=Ameca splendens TaxID=208324 RepID=A0ABV0Y3E5_9TELE
MVLVAFLINALLSRPVSLGGRPCLGRSAVGPSSLRVQMMDRTELWEMFKAWHIVSKPNPALNFSTTFSLSCLMCSLSFMMLVVLQCSLTSEARNRTAAGRL